MARKYIARTYTFQTGLWNSLEKNIEYGKTFPYINTLPRNEEKDIIDWELSPTSIQKKWNDRLAIPSNEEIIITFPELYLLQIYGNSEPFEPLEEYVNRRKAEELRKEAETARIFLGFAYKPNPNKHIPKPVEDIKREWLEIVKKREEKFAFKVELTPNDFVEIDPLGNDLGNIRPSYPDRKVRIRLRYKNFSQLPLGDTSLILTIKTFHVFGAGAGEEELKTEVQTIPITLKREGYSGGNSKDNYTPRALHMILNNASRELFVEGGDILEVPLYIQNISNFFVLWQKFGGVAHHSEEASHWKEPYTYENDGLFKVDVDNDDFWAWAKFSLSEKYKRTGVVDGFDFTHDQVIVKEDNLFFGHNFTIKLTVINDVTSFTIDKKHYEATLFRDKTEKYENSFYINNANKLTYTLTPTAGLEIVEVKNNGAPWVLVKFRSKSSETFPLGLQEEYITVKSNKNSTQIVTVNLNIKTDLDFEQKDIYFCLDKDILTIAQTNEKSEFAQVKLEMKFSGYGNRKLTTQEYEYVFFNNKAKIDLGEEIQDFFENIPNLRNLYINDENTVLPVEVMKATEVNVTIEETNFKGEVFKTYKLSSLRYLPGRTPLSYPYLTNAVLRSTYTNSLISVSALTKSFKRNELGKITSNSVDSSRLADDYGVANLCFYRKNANRFFGKNTIINKSTLSLEPKPEPNGEPITVLFQNQNFCPDWFSFSGELEHLINYENTLSQHAEKDEEFKALVKEKRTFKLNTGWIFPEEVELLWELIKSPQCFIKANDTDWVKVIPISQKPLSYDNTRNLHSYVVEFQRASIQ